VAALPNFQLVGRRALVTGASSGLGQHFARTLASAGARVALVARRRDRLERVVRDLEASGATAIAVEMDVTHRKSVVAALEEISVAFGGPANVIVNNAGTTAPNRALDLTDADWDSVVDTNLKGAWMVAQESARALVAQRMPGSIINVTSILAGRVAGSLVPYCASKAGLSHVTRALALELARHGIRVNSLAPGYVETDLNRDYLQSEAGAALRGRIPLRRFGDAADLDGALLLLASDAGRFMTGSEIVVDGGHICASL
jgi:NAD(P)-dependent dehydrogenase (short-subunit alcohol dehydrogenase family)